MQVFFSTTFTSSLSLADGISIPHTFMPNTTARASEVNENFSAVKAAIENHNHRLSEQKTIIEGQETRLSDLERDPDLATLLVGEWIAKSFNNGFHGETGSITFHSNGSFSLNGGTASILPGCSMTCSPGGGTWDFIDGGLIKLNIDGTNSSGRPYEASYVLPVISQKKDFVLMQGFNMTVLIRQ